MIVIHSSLLRSFSKLTVLKKLQCRKGRDEKMEKRELSVVRKIVFLKVACSGRSEFIRRLFSARTSQFPFGFP